MENLEFIKQYEAFKSKFEKWGKALLSIQVPNAEEYQLIEFEINNTQLMQENVYMVFAKINENCEVLDSKTIVINNELLKCSDEKFWKSIKKILN